jgi:hypothetical protein
MGQRLCEVAPHGLRGILDALLDIRVRVGLAFGVLRVVDINIAMNHLET